MVRRSTTVASSSWCRSRPARAWAMASAARC